MIPWLSRINDSQHVDVDFEQVQRPKVLFLVPYTRNMLQLAGSLRVPVPLAGVSPRTCDHDEDQQFQGLGC